MLQAAVKKEAGVDLYHKMLIESCYIVCEWVH